LQYLVLAAHGIKGDAPPAAAPKPKPAEAKPDPEPEPEAKKPAAEEESKNSGGGSGATVDVDDGSVEKTAAMVSAIISKPAMRPKTLQRPPFRFVHDCVVNIMKETGFALDKLTDEEKDTKKLPKANRQAVLQKVFEITATALGIDIDVSPAKLCAGKECEKTRQFLQYFCIAATGKKVGAVSAAAAAPAPAKKLRPVQEPKPVKPEPVSATESKTDNVELPDKPRAQSRPTTARRAPPKLANAAQKRDRKKEFVLEDVGTDGGIMDDDEESSSSDDDVEEEQSKRKHKKGKKDKSKRRGKLVSKIENELNQNEKKKKSGKEVKEEKKEKEESGIRLRTNIKKRRPNDQINVDNLQTQIQNLVRSTNPLAKCMDFVNDDLEAMDSEIDKWKNAYRRHSAKLEEEERKTTEQLAPLRQNIDNVDKEVAAVLLKIQECKAKIKQNDSRVTEMLRFVVNQK